MLRTIVAALVYAASATASPQDTVEYRFPARGIENAGLWCGHIRLAASIRADVDTFISVRAFGGRAANEANGATNEEIEVYGVGPELGERLLTTIRTSRVDGDSYPRCSLDIRMPSSVGILTDLNAESGSRVVVDGLCAMAGVKLPGGDVQLLNHSGPADVYGLNVVCSILAQDPADTLRLEGRDKLDLYYPDKTKAEVHVPACTAPAVEGLKTSCSMAGQWVIEYTLNPDAPGPARYIDLVRGGAVRPLAEYGTGGK